MSKVRWKKLIDGQLDIDGCRQYSYSTRQNETLHGLFVGEGLVMSMGFNDGAEFNFHGYHEKHTRKVAPDSRYFKFNQPLKGETIRGTVINVALQDFLNIPIYVLIKTD